LIAGCADGRGPRLASVTPSAAQRDAMVELVGERLCGEDGNCETAGGQVEVGLDLPAVRANTVEIADTRIVIVIPQTAEIGPTELVLVVNERSSNALDFEVLP
jgi:hypothetical protein